MQSFSVNIYVKNVYCLSSNDQTFNNSCLSSFSYVYNHQIRTGLVMRDNIKCTLCNRLAKCGLFQWLCSAGHILEQCWQLVMCTR